MNASTSDSASKSKMNRGKISWPESPSIKQNFSLPSSIIYYIAKNPSSSEVYDKLIESCKYFFEKNPIIVTPNMDDHTVCLNDATECHKCDKECCIKLDLEKLSSKIWLTNQFISWDLNTTEISPSLFSKIYRSDVKHLEIHGKNVKFDDFQFLASSVRDVYLNNVTMTDNNGRTVMLEKILESIPTVERFYYFFGNDLSMITVSSLKNITKLKNLDKLEYFRLYNLQETFSVEDLKTFIKSLKNTKVKLHFHRFISVEFRNQLDGFVDDLIESKESNCFIKYCWQNAKKFQTMKNRFLK